MVQNIKRDPFEQAAGIEGQKTALGFGGALAAPSTAYLYDWNILPIGQLLWEKELDVVRGVPAAAGPGDLQPQWDPATDKGPTLKSPQRLKGREGNLKQDAGAQCGARWQPPGRAHRPISID